MAMAMTSQQRFLSIFGHWHAFYIFVNKFFLELCAHWFKLQKLLMLVAVSGGAHTQFSQLLS